MTSASVRLQPGDPAPDFTLPDADGNAVTLSAYRGSRVVVYFYPQASTPGCTTQACDFRDSLASLSAAGVSVIGVSPDQPAALATFRDAQGLTFPLLSDPEHVALSAYGTWGDKKNYGRTYQGVLRSTFVVDGEGNLEQAQYNVKATGHVAKLRRDLGL